MGIVKVVKGNLLAAFKNTDIELIAHGCNCRNLMGAGIAQKLLRFSQKLKKLTGNSIRSLATMLTI